MKPATHKRFLNYLESWEYFRRPDRKKLDRDTFAALDDELVALLERQKAEIATAAEAARIAVLRKQLFRD